jgi:nucleoside-diphosphate-sugar epimerase
MFMVKDAITQAQEAVLVTGASGYLASWVVKELLDAECIVHATVRKLNDDDKIAHLQEMANAYPGKLKLFAADLLTPDSFDAAMTGCGAVIHTASPYFHEKPKDIELELIKPAVNGTMNVIASVNRTASVKRVVLTSSIAALYDDNCDAQAYPGNTVTERHINSNQDMTHNSYAYSKTAAETAAWQSQKLQSRWDMVSIHPGAIFGPSLSKRVDATSVGMVVQFLNGSFRMGVPRLWLGVVDVRDVARTHVQALLVPTAHGRYIAVAESMTLLQAAGLMRPTDAGLPDKLPRRESPKSLVWLIAPFVGLQRDYVMRNVGHPINFDNARSKSELGIVYRLPADTFNDHIRQIIADGLVKA